MTNTVSYEFSGRVEERSMGENKRGPLVYWVVYAPKATLRRIGVGPKERCRLVGTVGRVDGVDGESIQLALNPDPRGHYLMVSKALMKKVGAGVGERIRVCFEVADPNEVAIPDELRDALARDEDAAHVWASLTAGKQRMWTTHVGGAKRTETRTRRAAEVIERLLVGDIDPRPPRSRSRRK